MDQPSASSKAAAPADDAAVIAKLHSVGADWSAAASKLRDLLAAHGVHGVSEKRLKRLKQQVLALPLDIFRAAHGGDEAAVKAWLAGGGHVDACDEDQVTLLMGACAGGRERCQPWRDGRV